MNSHERVSLTIRFGMLASDCLRTSEFELRVCPSPSHRETLTPDHQEPNPVRLHLFSDLRTVFLYVSLAHEAHIIASTHSLNDNDMGHQANAAKTKALRP